MSSQANSYDTTNPAAPKIVQLIDYRAPKEREAEISIRGA
jgi:hypothetical protein